MSGALADCCLQAFPEPLMLLGRTGRIKAANDPAAILLGLPKGTVPEVTLRELAALSNAELSGILNLCLATSAPLPLRLTFYPAGAPPLNTRCEAWRCHDDGAISAVLRIVRESEAVSRFSELTKLIDELNQECIARRYSESRLRAALAQIYDINGIRDHMLAQVSHDLRTPLNAILGMAEFMQQQPFGPFNERYSTYLQDIHVSGKTLLQLVDQVLHLAWDAPHGQEMVREPLADLGECLENCCQVVEPIARMRGLQIMVPADMALPRLRADRLLVKQILMNLLGNAAKYCDQGSRIEVAVEWREDSSLAIRVKDNGPGIPAEKLAVIEQAEAARDPYVARKTRVGFGLALSRRTAGAIGAHLDIRSELGRGTVASLVLPPHLVEANPPAEQSALD